ncbi:MAG: hypothetical protein WA354_19645 [Terracidiphilus sp.]
MSHARARLAIPLIFAFSLFFALPTLHAQEKTTDVDSYKWRVTGMWWFSHPTGDLRTSGDQVSWDLSKDFDFGNYSTFTGGVDWHFKRKHHLIFAASPVYSTKSATITRDITFQGVTYHTGATVTADLNSLTFSPGYQYDFIRRHQGYLALVVSLHLLDTTGRLTGTGTVNNVSATRTASGSTFAPLPVLGPEGRWYPIHDSNRFSIAGGFQGMYFFGYGNFMFSQGTAQVRLYKGVDFKAGYQMGTRLSIQGTNNRVGFRLTQQGPVAGLEASW